MKRGRRLRGWCERECLPVTWHTTLENQSQKQRILEATHKGGQVSIWAVNRVLFYPLLSPLSRNI